MLIAFQRIAFCLTILRCFSASFGQEASIVVHRDKVMHEVTRYMTGSCIEDVNHEIYGGIYSQMIFGESFQEAASPPPLERFTAYGGTWAIRENELLATGGQGTKLISDTAPFRDGMVSVEIQFAPNLSGLIGNAGLIVKVTDPEIGADNFHGYEISLDPKRQIVTLARHRNNWEPLKDAPCKVPTEQWIKLAVRLQGPKLEVLVDKQVVLTYEEDYLPGGAIGFRTWLKSARFRNLKIDRGRSGTTNYFFGFTTKTPGQDDGVSKMWRAVRRGSVTGNFALETNSPFIGSQSQQITFKEGTGEIGIENSGLNRWGMNVVAGKPYEGYLWLKCEQPTIVRVSLESSDGKQNYAQSPISASGSEWNRYDFTLTPNKNDAAGRFTITLDKPGSIVVGHAFLQPGEWGRYKGMPIRRDVAEALIDQGVTVLRLGGLMANAAGYRWKSMLGPRDRRPQYTGYWYEHTTNGFGIIEFLNFCEAAGFLAIPDFNMDETPQDMVDFVEYVNGSPETAWGKRRTQDGHPVSYKLKYIQLGNEEKVDESYWQKFKPLAEAIWAKDAEVILIVGDFEYKKPITDPDNLVGAPMIKSLAAHKKILDLAKAHNREIWVDAHIWNHNPREADVPIVTMGTLADAFAKLSPGANFKLCVLEENATNHAMRRAVAHAETINGLMRMGDQVKIVCAANCLQPYKQNDHGWDQGLLFLSPSQVWGQPPYYVTQMYSKNFRPQCLKVETKSPNDVIDALALSGDGGLTLCIVNRGGEKIETQLSVKGLDKTFSKGEITQLTGPLDAVNTPEEPTRVVPWHRSWNPKLDGSGSQFTFAPWSVTVMNFEP